MMLAAVCVYAESYAGFEVKEGSGGTKVIVLQLSDNYSAPDDGKYEIEFPVEYYKLLEKELIEYDDYINLSDEKIKGLDKTLLIEKNSKLEKIYNFDKESLGNKSKEIYNWQDIEEESESENYYWFLLLFEDIKKATDGLKEYIFTIQNGYNSSELSVPRKYLVPLLELKETFPAVELKKLDIRIK